MYLTHLGHGTRCSTSPITLPALGIPERTRPPRLVPPIRFQALLCHLRLRSLGDRTRRPEIVRIPGRILLQKVTGRGSTDRHGSGAGQPGGWDRLAFRRDRRRWTGRAGQGDHVLVGSLVGHRWTERRGGARDRFEQGLEDCGR